MNKSGWQTVSAACCAPGKPTRCHGGTHRTSRHTFPRGRGRLEPCSVGEGGERGTVLAAKKMEVLFKPPTYEVLDEKK